MIGKWTSTEIHKILSSFSSENQRAQLVQAFYLPNGILKEYALHDINVQTIKMPASILEGLSTDIRQQLNTLIGMRIKNPQEATRINNAIKYLLWNLKKQHKN